MVYFKLTKDLLDLVLQSKLEGLVGCQKYCDRQYISYSDLDKVIQKLRREFTKAKDKLQKKTELEKKRKDLAASNSDLMKQFELMDFVNKNKITETTEELEEQIKEFQKHENLDIKELVVNAEIVFLDEHICNDNLKKRGKDEAFFKPEEIIEENEKAKKSLKQLEHEFGEDPKAEMRRIEDNKVLHEQIQGRKERREYQKMTQDLSYNDPDNTRKIEEAQEFRFTLAFGFGFITLMFLSFICGYFLGTRVFGLSSTQSLILSLVVGISTIIMETILFVIRMEKMEAEKRKRVKQE